MLMDLPIKENGKTDSQMGKEHYIFKMDQNILGLGERASTMAMVCMNLRVRLSMMECGIWANMKEKVDLNGQMDLIT